MPEVFWNYNQYIENIDVKWDQVPDWFNENQIKNKAKNYVEKRIFEWISSEDYQKLLQEIKTILEKQDIERLNLTEEIEWKILQETREELDKEALIQQAKTILYEKLWIHENQERNSKTENFLKWIVDVLVIDNYDLAIQIWQTNWKVVIDALKNLMSWDWLKQIAEALWESLISLFSWNAYEKWQAVWELWLVTTWIWVTAVVWRKSFKVWMKEIVKHRAKKEVLVNTPEIKWVISETNKKIENIVPKKEVDFDKMLIEDIGKESIDELPNWNKKIDRQYLQEDIPREDILLREVSDFQEIPSDKASLIDTKLVDVINTVPYNSFEKLEKLLEEFERQKFINPNATLLDAFNKMDFSKLNRWEWSNCVWMSYLLQQDLLEQWIKSHLVRFDVWPMLNPEYVVNWHSALIIPRMLQAEKHFTLADPWLLIPKTITFAEWKRSAPITIWKSTYVVAMDWKDGLPYVMDINSPQRNKKLYFDPHHEWINPNTTLNKDIMRAIWDFKIVKGEKYFKTDLEKSTISLWYEWKKITISYEDFQKMRNFEWNTQIMTESGLKSINNGVFYREIFSKIVEHLGKQPDTFFEINNKLIQMSGDYRKQIWAPSTRDKVKSN